MSISSTVHPRSWNARAAWCVMRGDVGVDLGETEVGGSKRCGGHRLVCLWQLWVAAMKSGGADRMEMGSRRSNPAIVWRSNAASLTVLAMGPGCPKKLGAGGTGNAVVSGDASEGWFDGVCSAEV